MARSSAPRDEVGGGAAAPGPERRRAAATLPLILTCEHGGNRVPERFAPLFQGEAARRLLGSHRGWDPGALELARALGRATGAPLLHATVTRLLVDLNRSEGNRTVFSELTRDLPAGEREEILRRYHRPYRARVEAAVRSRLGAGGAGGACGPVVHVSFHSFTPVLDGRRRDVDVGLLYDPRRDAEVALSRRWRTALREVLREMPRDGLREGLREVPPEVRPDLRVRSNRPYRGTSDGLTRSLRRTFAPADYVGVELEVSQGLLEAGPGARCALHDALAESLLRALVG